MGEFVDYFLGRGEVGVVEAAICGVNVVGGVDIDGVVKLCRRHCMVRGMGYIYNGLDDFVTPISSFMGILGEGEEKKRKVFFGFLILFCFVLFCFVMFVYFVFVNLV